MSVAQRLWTLRSINGVPFGCAQAALLEQLGNPDALRQNYNGELEFLYAPGDTIYRCAQEQFVEASFAADCALSVDGVLILSAFDWLAGQEDVVDLARFRISLALGIAYDYRDPEHGSITVFGRGHWDALVLGR